MSLILESIQEISRHSRRCLQLYSGGLDSTAFTFLAKQQGIEIIALHFELGPEICPNKYADLASQLKIDCQQINLIETFANHYVAKAILANACYKNIFPICSSLSRPLMIEKAIEFARKFKADTIVHTAGYEQNTANRFNQSIRILAPDLNIGCPFIRNSLSRQQKKSLLQEAGIVVPKTIYSIDENLWGRVIECGELDNPSNEVPDNLFIHTVSSIHAPKATQKITLDFEKGIPVAINNERLSLRQIISKLTTIAGKYGIGRYNGLEDTIWGIKNHEVREAPAAAVLLLAHTLLESATLTQRELKTKVSADQEWTDLVVNGYWHTPLKQALQQLIERLNEKVNGQIGLSFSPGQVYPYSLNVPTSPHFYNGGKFIQDQFKKLNYAALFEIKNFSLGSNKPFQ